jgi:hypothetical protein
MDHAVHSRFLDRHGTRIDVLHDSRVGLERDQESTVASARRSQAKPLCEKRW